MGKTGTDEHKEMARAMTLHNPPAHPHWSEAVEWPADRWDPLCNAPSEGYPILEVRGRTADGQIVEPMHRACGDGDGMMQPFDGWFVPYRLDKQGGFYEVRPVEWQPLRARHKPTNVLPNADIKEVQ